MKPIVTPTLILTGLLALAACHWATPPRVHADMAKSEVEQRLTCQCGCGLTVATCNHLQCGFAVPVREDIGDSLERGETGDEIIARYLEKYGEKILSSPTTEGFNLLAWIGPYLAVFAAGIFVVIKVRRSVSDESLGLTAEAATTLNKEDRDRIEEELKEL